MDILVYSSTELGSLVVTGLLWTNPVRRSHPWEVHSKCAAESQRTQNEDVISTIWWFDGDHVWWPSSSTCIFSLLTFFFSLWDIALEFKLVFLEKHGLYIEKATILPSSSVIFSPFFHFLYPANLFNHLSFLTGTWNAFSDLMKGCQGNKTPLPGHPSLSSSKSDNLSRSGQMFSKLSGNLLP